MSDREEVDQVHERAVAAGAEVLHPPREWPYAPRYYATFFLDPDGFRVEVLVKWVSPGPAMRPGRGRRISRRR